MEGAKLGSDDEKVYRLICLHRSLELGEFLKSNLGPLFPHSIISNAVKYVLDGMLNGGDLVGTPEANIIFHIPLTDNLCHSFIDSIWKSTDFDYLLCHNCDLTQVISIDMTCGEPPFKITRLSSEIHEI